MNGAPVTPVILSGGSGTRLWPLSRALYPKQFVTDLNGRTESLLATTLARLPPSEGFTRPIVVCNNAHRFLVREHAERAGIKPQHIVLEPLARNTGPAITVAALIANEKNPATILVVMPSDHLIADHTRFSEAVNRAASFAAEGRIVLFGVNPDSSKTGYGYIRRGALIEGGDGAFKVERFCEKPDATTAAQYVADGHHVWNSGIFVFRADTFLREIGALNPDLVANARLALSRAVADLEFLRLDLDAFGACPNISVDYAVMEHTQNAIAYPLNLAWSDLGSWGSLWDAAPPSENGNYTQGDVLLQDTANCYIRSDKSLVAAIGVDDLVIVETPDCVLVADKSRSEDVAKFVQQLRVAGRAEYEQHRRNLRPWGFFETLNIAARFQVKLLHVKPGGMLSLQMHHHRSEHWVVVQGTARVTVEGNEHLVKENESVYISATKWHRLENPGKVPLELVEVQIGTYLGEDDIIRSDDIYLRSPDETR